MYGLPMFQILLCFIAFILHIIAISSSYWTNFYARTEFGMFAGFAGGTYESGHFGLWLICYNEPFQSFRPYGGYSGREYCDLVDTMFRTPPFLGFARVLAVIATLTILLYFPFAIMRQKYINSPYASKSSMARNSGAFKLAIATMAAVLTVLVMILVSVRENEMGVRDFVPLPNFRGYWLTKGWAFYVEAVVALILLVLALLSLMDNNRPTDVDTINRFPAATIPYNIQQAEQLGQPTKAQSTLPRRTRNEYVDSPNNLRLPHSSQNSISGQAADDRINLDDDIDQVDEDTASPLDDDLTRLNPHIRRSSRYPVKSSTTKSSNSAGIAAHKITPLSVTTSAQPFSYHRSPATAPLNRNLAKSSTDIRSPRSLSNPRYHPPERRNSLERNERITLPTHVPINTYKSSPSQRAYYDSSPFSPINNYEFNNEPLLSSPLLSISKSNLQQLATSDNQLLGSGNSGQPQRFRTRIISTETTTETSTTLKRPQSSLNNSIDKSMTGTIRYHNIDSDPLDRN